MTAGLSLARATGGSLAPLLDTLAETLRERERLRGQVRALTAQGRLSGYVVGATPVVMLLVMWLIDPAFVAPVFTTPLGYGMLAAAAVLEALGAVGIRAVVRIEP
jgi:tight adherence protein B